MTHTPIHRCTERECHFFGQVTTDGCSCHKTTEQMLVEQRDSLVAALDWFFEKMEAGILVRNTKDDINSDWALRSMRFVGELRGHYETWQQARALARQP